MELEEGVSSAEATLDDDKPWAAASVRSQERSMGQPGHGADLQHHVYTQQNFGTAWRRPAETKHLSQPD